MFVGDLSLLSLSLYLAFATRFWSLYIPNLFLELYWRILPLSIVVYSSLFFHFGLYHGIWRFASFRDLLAIARAIIIGTIIVIIGVFFLPGFQELPRPILVINAFYLAIGITLSRFTVRLRREFPRLLKLRDGIATVRTLLLGAGETGEIILRELHREGTKLLPIGFLDDDPLKQGSSIHGVRILGTIDDLPRILEALQIEEVIVTAPSISGERMRWIFEICQKAKVKSRTVPRMSDILAGRVQVDLLRPIALEDLLEREPIKIENKRIRGILEGKRILVTGAGGSIGSELCRQVAGYRPESMLLLEQGESSLFYIHGELKYKFPDLKVFPVVGDICNRRKVATLFNEYKPNMVLHAAAYKHVPMMEINPDESIRNNVFGTKILVDISEKTKVSNFIMLSTDKAVNPVGIMGKSKRLAEIYLQSRHGKSSTRFSAVRFGNVLGSVGSVVPIFKQQIEAGGPITVTHPDIKRFFMTIPEAVELILFAATVSQGSEVLVLEMGRLVKITDLARNMITLAGLKPDEDIKIVYVGLRAGEKLFEELYYPINETLLETEHPMIKVVQPKNTVSEETVTQVISLLEKLLEGQRPNTEVNDTLTGILLSLGGEK